MSSRLKRKSEITVKSHPSLPPEGVIHFTVDSALLRELGERLVGKPHIALAELIKNSYDADATKVELRFNADSIEVRDNGYGMDFSEFQRFWMRIGSPHKQQQLVSRNFGRPVTGSKGVGRLAVQFLGNKLKLRTVSEKNKNLELYAEVNWNEAIHAGDLTEAVAKYKIAERITTFPDNSRHGTVIVISALNQEWSANDLTELAREIWWLQPPFRQNPRLVTEKQKGFVVELTGLDQQAVEKFERQMRAYLDIWHARIVGKLIPAKPNGKKSLKVRLFLEFSDGENMRWEFSAPKLLSSLEFEIRVFHLRHRQRFGIQVDTAREYLNQFGGVHVYDAGFHLPYYGIEHDWLDIEIDHSHRLSKSKLLPDSLQISEGMNYLPTQTRLLGVVHVDTSYEREVAIKQKIAKQGEYLKIQISRDRLVDNDAYQILRKAVRTALDFYAMQEARRAIEEIQALSSVEPVSHKFNRVDRVLTYYKDAIPDPVFNELRTHVREAIQASETESEQLVRQVGLLGSLATAGISALAYQHEVTKQFHLLEGIIEQLRSVPVRDAQTKKSLSETADQISEWLQKARSMRSLFSYLMDEENREIKARFKAKELVRQVVDQMAVLVKGVAIDVTHVDESIRLPEGGFAEWSAILQNVILNAVNAMLDVRVKKIDISSRTRGDQHSLLIQDTGVGVDLESSEDLFKPFVRKLRISAQRKALGFGGSGLGLAIVRMISENLQTTTGFTEPDKGFRTAFVLSWNEGK